MLLVTDRFVALVAALAAALCFTGVFLAVVVVPLAAGFFSADLWSCFAVAAYAHVNGESHGSIGRPPDLLFLLGLFPGRELNLA